MKKKDKEEISDEFDQVQMLGFPPSKQEQQNSKELVTTEIVELLELTQEKPKYMPNKTVIQAPYPTEVLKNRSNMIDEVINLSPELESGVEIQSIEQLDQSSTTIPIRFSISSDQYRLLDKEIAQILTQFDREVIDAVGSLAQHIPLLSASTIYRTITGKPCTASVSKSDREKVNNSMSKCRACLLAINVTDEMRKAVKLPNEDKIFIKDPIINYTEMLHEGAAGCNYLYKINNIPIIHQYAKGIGKLSLIPMALLDTPINKSDSVLAVQSFLLRSIDESMKNKNTKLTLAWDSIYEVSGCNANNRVYTKRVRDYVEKMLSFWAEHLFIDSFVLFDTDPLTKKKNLMISHPLMA